MACAAVRVLSGVCVTSLIRGSVYLNLFFAKHGVAGLHSASSLMGIVSVGV